MSLPQLDKQKRAMMPINKCFIIKICLLKK
jgi:hypothetical protein